MKKPLLQIALDNLTIKAALENIEQVKNEIDVIEIGTILLAAEGKKAIKTISAKYPNKIIVADGKIADAGTIFGKMFFENGAKYTTAICAAEIPTIAAVVQVAKQFGLDREVQVELTSWFTFAQAEAWRKVGVTQVVYHRARDAQAAGLGWSKKDLANIEKLIKLGFKVTVTGGITIDDIKLFKDLPIYIFIAGRAIREANDPQKAAQKLQAEIAKYW